MKLPSDLSGLGIRPAGRSAATAQHLILALSFLLAVIFATFPGQNSVERAIQNVRNEINSKPASGAIHLVEIDAKSLQVLENWPWPRRHHADLINQLEKAGATQIVFDVDFSSYSSEVDDAAFADAIAKAGGKVVLPTFRQAASSDDATAEVESLPIKQFRENAFLGSVNVRPSKSGQVNSYPYGTITEGTARPSIAALLADANGPLNTEFDIDQSIEIDTIPKHSFVDIIQGRYDPVALKGKKVIIGATAIEIGDRYATSRFGVIPGVVVQTLAAETLIAGMALPQLGPWPMLLFTLFALVICTVKLSGRDGFRQIALFTIFMIIAATPLISERFKLAHLEVVPALLMVLMFAIAQHIVGMWQKLQNERQFDSDTGLPNFTSWQSQTQPMATVIVADIANFEEIFSTLDEAGAINFVRGVASRLEVATNGSPLFRIGREQFCWNAPISSIDKVDGLLNGAAHLFNAPIHIENRPIRATICFGVIRDETSEPGALANKAALASKKANEIGARIVWHSEGLANTNEESLFILSEFEEALVTGQILVVYQPKYDLSAKKVKGAEALVRWQHPEKGAISPSIFVPILEQENLMEALTLFVLRQVVDQLQKWNSFSEPMGCAVNISAPLLLSTAFVDRAINIIKSGEIDPRLLTIELTETGAVSSLEHAYQNLQRFKILGTRLSIDDYGTGQSTLSYLRKFDADEVKIDQSFVQLITTDRANYIMVQSTIEMAKSLSVSVVAEGVEDTKTMDVLNTLGCDIVQGWHIGKPVSAVEFLHKWCQPLACEQPTRRGQRR